MYNIQYDDGDVEYKVPRKYILQVNQKVGFCGAVTTASAGDVVLRICVCINIVFDAVPLSTIPSRVQYHMPFLWLCIF